MIYKYIKLDEFEDGYKPDYTEYEFICDKCGILKRLKPNFKHKEDKRYDYGDDLESWER